MKNNYNCIIVEDDELDRLSIVALTRKHHFITITSVYASAEEALAAITQSDIDMIISGIDMPGMSGIELRRQIMQIPVCIFITSYPDYAIESFEVSVLDFLLKPLKADRFEAAMNRAKAYLDVKLKAGLFEYYLGGDTIFIKDGHSHIKISLHEVIYPEALKDYTVIVTPQRKYYVLAAISNLLKEKGFNSFIRIHRSYAVQKLFVNNVGRQHVKVSDIVLPVGRSYRDNLDAIIL